LWLRPLLHCQVNDPFQILGLPARFDLDPKELEEQHRLKSLIAHPDRLRGRGASERRQALSLAMNINEAHRTLRDPIARALALLEVRGHLRAELPEKPLDPEYLMLTLERRERLRDARLEKNEQQVSELVRAVLAEKARALDALHETFNVPGQLSEAALGKVDRALSELRYAERFLDEAEAGEA
jgi:DnaJ-domain-containing protein 1